MTPRISQKEYQSKPETYWKGKKVKAEETLGNSLASLPIGTIFTITRKHKGFNLESEPCSSCGIKVRITYVNPLKLTLLDELEEK